MDRVAHMVGEKVGEVVEGAVKQVLGVKDKNSDKKKGGGLSLFGGNKKKEAENEGKGGFMSKLFDKGDDDKGVKKSTGFSGLFAEQEDGAGERDGGACEYNPPEGTPGPGETTGGGGGGGLYDDLLDVAAEMSTQQ